jgi:hypothetical protein
MGLNMFLWGTSKMYQELLVQGNAETMGLLYRKEDSCFAVCGPEMLKKQDLTFSVRCVIIRGR